jgi:hypothetical protein
MHGASAARSQVIGILLLWAAIFVASFVVPVFVEPTGESYFRGLNRLAYWFWLQVAAVVLALVVCVWAQVRQADISRRLVWLSRVPLLVAGAEVLALWATL